MSFRLAAAMEDLLVALQRALLKVYDAFVNCFIEIKKINAC